MSARPGVILRYLGHVLAAVVATASTLAAAQDYDLPSIGQPADTALSPADEQRIGERVVSQLLQQGLIIEDPELTEYIGRVGWRLASHTDRAPSRFQFYVIDDTAVNAFALPGGYIGVNAGLILESDTESELAGVLAHEIAHVTQRHIARQLEATKGLTWATAAAMLLAIIAGGGNPAVVQAAIALGVSNLGQQQINFTRAHEMEADRLGIRTLAAAHYDPNAMAGFFGKMERRSRLYGNQLPEILQTHPISETRISEAQARARDYSVSDIKEFDAYPLMRARARVLSSKQPSEVVRYFEQQRASDKGGVAADYGYALALTRVGRSQAAIDILRKLDDNPADYPYFTLALAHARATNGDIDGALTTLAKIKSRYPSYRPLILAYAQALLDNGRAQDARDYLVGKNKLLSQDPQAHKLLADAADQLGHKGEAYYRQAEYHHLRGEYAAAVHKLLSALRLPDISDQDKARIKATLAQYRSQCAQKYSEDECRERVEGDRPIRGGRIGVAG